MSTPVERHEENCMALVVDTRPIGTAADRVDALRAAFGTAVSTEL